MKFLKIDGIDDTNNQILFSKVVSGENFPRKNDHHSFGYKSKLIENDDK